jgi:hypothetical protein
MTGTVTSRPCCSAAGSTQRTYAGTATLHVIAATVVMAGKRRPIGLHVPKGTHEQPHAAHAEHLRAAGKFVQRLEKLDLLADTSKDGLLSAIPLERLRSLNAAAALARQLLTLHGPLECELGISIVRHRYLQAANKPRRHVVYPAA